MQKTASPTDVIKIKTDQLLFDPDNPRFYRLNQSGQDYVAVIEDMLDREGAQDLMNSIAQKGYFGGEPLLVVSESGEAPFTVVEGNRRLAAVKLLNGQIVPPARRKNSIKNIRDEAVVEPPLELPCLIYTNRKDVLRYLGYRHITGIQEWDALSKAKYLKELKNEFYADKNLDEQFRGLAKDIGSKPDYVAKLLVALELYEKAKNNDNFYALPLNEKDIEFSYITTALGYRSIPDWLGLDSPKDVMMENLNEDKLKLIFGWFFSKDQTGNTIIGESRNINELSQIVKDERAIAQLIETKDLSVAYLYTDGPAEALTNALEAAKKKMNMAWMLVPETTAIKVEHLDIAEEIFNFAKNIKNAIRNKLEDE